MASEQQFKTYAVDALSREICALSGNVFETWAYALIPLVIPKVHWHHRGTTALGAPVGYTIDSSGDQATCVAQFSSLKNYFTTTKPIDDLKSTIAKHPHTKEIWLLAAVESSPSDRTESDNAIAAWKLANPGIAVRDLDSRQIAALIVENLESDELVRLLQDRLPSLARIADENAFSHSVPEMGAYVTRPDAESATRDLLSTNKYAIIGGLSGVGKSALAVSILRKWDAETRVWIDASDLTNPEQLKSVSVGRRGLSHNLVNILRTRRCALVLDNLGVVWPAEAFRRLAGESSVIIVTSQLAGARKDAVVLGNAPREVAEQILRLDGAPTCDAETLDVVLTATSGHPLLLRILGALASATDDGWKSAVECCESIVTHGEDDRNEKVCRRVLNQHLPNVRDELGVFVWCDSPAIDRTLIQKCSSPLAKANLEKRHFLAASTTRIVRLHDIVYKSAVAELPLAAADTDRYRDRLDSFFRDDDDALVFERVARKHHDLMERELDRKHSWELLYAVARARITAKSIKIFDRTLQDIHASLGKTPSDIAVRAVIEAIEATYSLTAEHATRREAKERLEALMPAFDFMGSLPLPSTLRGDIRHHRAKMLIRLERQAEAETDFRALLKDSPNFHGAKLQLIRLLAKDKPDEARALTEELVEASDASPNIQIESWVELSRLAPELVASRVTRITEVLKAVTTKDVAAAYAMVAKVGAALSYNRPDVALTLFTMIQDGDPFFSTDRERLDWARSHVVAAKALRDKLDTAEAKRLLHSARETYESVSQDRIPPFNRVQFAECLLLLGDHASARHELGLVPDGKDRNEFWWHRVAQSELGLGNASVAFDAIENALAALRDPKYRATFLEVRFDIRRFRRDPGALDDLKSAIECVNDAKYREQLTRKLESEQSVD